jgi:predicted transcriptional regulator
MLPDTSEIKEMRKSLGLTQLELAKIAGISRPSLVKLENGQIDLAYSKVKRIFDELEVLRNNRKGSLIETVTLASIHTPQFVALDVNTSMNDVYVRIHETGFSQFVITDSGKIVGSITDKKAFGALREHGNDVKESHVGEFMDDSFPILSENTPVIRALPLILFYQAVLTAGKGKDIGIVTNNDVGRIFAK